MLVDHYALLELPPSATPAEIKAAYRKLARLHHPDVNPQDLRSVDRFRAIQLAYETLTRPALRQAYLEKRWYAQHLNQSLRSQPLHLEGILLQCIELERFVATLDPHRMDRTGLHQHLLKRIEELTQVAVYPESQQTQIQTVLELLIKSARHLTLEEARIIHQRLHQWLTTIESEALLNDNWLLKKQRQAAWQRGSFWLVLLLTAVLSALIWISAR